MIDNNKEGHIYYMQRFSSIRAPSVGWGFLARMGENRGHISFLS